MRERDDSMARFVLATSDVEHTLVEVDVAATQVLNLARTHRGVGRDHRRAVDVLPLGIRGGGLEQALPLVCRQRSPDGPVALGQVADVVGERSPAAAELQHPRQHADVHVDGAIRHAGVVSGALELGDGCGGDSRQRRVAEVL